MHLICCILVSSYSYFSEPTFQIQRTRSILLLFCEALSVFICICNAQKYFISIVQEMAGDFYNSYYEIQLLIPELYCLLTRYQVCKTEGVNPLKSSSYCMYHLL
jgi:hypothetical protein